MSRRTTEPFGFEPQNQDSILCVFRANRETAIEILSVVFSGNSGSLCVAAYENFSRAFTMFVTVSDTGIGRAALVSALWGRNELRSTSRC
jgi:hypothetical protein